MAIHIERGQYVCAADGEALGNAARVETDSFVVESASSSATALVCSAADIEDVRNGGIRLSRMRAQLQRTQAEAPEGGT